MFPSSSLSNSSTASFVSTQTSQSTQPLMSSKKDYSSAFADLQSTYGFGGHVPSPISKKPKTSSKAFLPSFFRSRSQHSSSPSSTSSSDALPSKLGATIVLPLKRDETKTALSKEAQAHSYLAGKGVPGGPGSSMQHKISAL
ncbi:hypothetical protein ARMSODRAFT_956977 [Armillaria solidipes]|uniref:Uncharacterized protein n=1 Tax=Armillaria solidipes TaxID=1076256 RepID=A0A2H3BKF0_9AGAR|nr:hypothetical protein ARMSODRAFT_956977 [Armillaria solidipes]